MASIVGRARARILQRFADPDLELAYLTAQRAAQAPIIRLICAIFAVAILVTFPILFIYLPAAAFGGVSVTLVWFTFVLLTYAWAVGRPIYITGRWIDMAFFLTVLPGLYENAVRMVAVQMNGWNLSAQLGNGMAIAMAACCLAFVAAVSAYLLLAGVSVAAYIAALAFNGLSVEQMSSPVLTYVNFVVMLAFMNWAIDDKARRLFRATLELDAEKAKSDRLLDNVLPPVVAARLRQEEEVADAFDGVAILFADIVGFTRLSERLGSHGTVDLLTRYFRRADQGLERFGMEKIKTIGDAYMAVAGALTRPALPARAAVDFGAYLISTAREVGAEMELDLHVRVGVNMGEVVGGVIGTERLSYDYWGDTINVAARLEGLAPTDGITVSEAVHRSLADSHRFHPPRRALLKNLGERNVYDVDLEEVPA